MRTFLIAAFVLGSMAPPGGGRQETGFNEHLFEEFITMRGGDGTHPVYWYATGEMRSFPEGTRPGISRRLESFRNNYREMEGPIHWYRPYPLRAAAIICPACIPMEETSFTLGVVSP